MKNVHWRRQGEMGFSLIDMIATMAVMATISAIAVPVAIGTIENSRLGMAARDVERELQFARLKAVSTNRPMRVRFDCPVAGQIRAVELIGTIEKPDLTLDADSNLGRCSETTYPYSPTGADRSRLTRPNNDGPIRRLSPGTSFSVKQTLEFWPNGTVHANTSGANPWPIVGSTGVTLTLIRNGKSKNITVNGLGKIQMDR
jgi:type II secretory pathway pseudopilin PulG